MRRFSVCIRRGVLVVVVLALGTGCGPEAPLKLPPPLRVHLVIGGDADLGWIHGEAAIEHLLQETYGAVTTSKRVHTVQERRLALDAAGRHGLDIVFCIGSGFEIPVLSVTHLFPRTAFVLDHGNVVDPNVGRIEFLFGGAAYLGGVAAAVAGGSPIGIVDPGRSPEREEIEAGFEQGYRSRHPWGLFESVAGAGEIGLLPEAGVEIALYSEKSPNSGFLAVAEACGVRLVTFGSPRHGSSGDVVFASIVADIPEAVRRVVADVVDDTFVGKVYAFDLGSGVVDLKVHASAAEDEEVREALDQARDAVTAGMVEVEALGL
ncbi:MAG: hypothetical protein ABFS37_15050 [Acidobacteriota bacterium]